VQVQQRWAQASQLRHCRRWLALLALLLLGSQRCSWSWQGLLLLLARCWHPLLRQLLPLLLLLLLSRSVPVVALALVVLLPHQASCPAMLTRLWLPQPLRCLAGKVCLPAELRPSHHAQLHPALQLSMQLLLLLHQQA
jgi:hypothetical protein